MSNKYSTTSNNVGSKINAVEGSDTSKGASARRRIDFGMVQNILLIWLDNNIDNNNADYRDMLIQLQGVVLTVYTFTSTDECVDFLTDSYDQKAVIIISGTLCKKTVPLICDIDHLNTIFVLCRNKTRYEEWSKHWLKIKGVFTEVAPICSALQQAARQSEHDFISISFIDTDSNLANKSLDKLDCSYMYTQILKEILLSIEFEQKHVRESSHHCRNAVAETESEIIAMNQFEKQYHDKTPIWWYTYSSFLYPMVNRALRMMDTNIIIMMGFFIADLHRHIEQLHSTQIHRHPVGVTFMVYRGQGMSKTDFAKMIQTKGGLLSFNNFLSTSRDRDVSLAFAESIQSNPDLFGILFVMTIDPSQSTAPFASVSDVSHFEGEDEVLFSMHTVFRIRDITPIGENNRLFQVDLTLTSDKDKDLRVLTDRIREQGDGFTGWYRLGQLVLKMGHFEKAEQVYEMMLEETTSEREKGDIYDRLGITKYNQGKYQEAIISYENALEITRKTLPLNDPNLGISYNNIGLVYHSLGEYSKAFSSYEKALAIQQQSLSPDHPDLGGPYNNIGMVYYDNGEYSKALSSYEKALTIRLQSLPANHPDLGGSYHNIALVYNNMGEYSKALSSYEKALKIRQQSLPPNHPDLGASYSNIGNVYDKKGDYSKALTYYEKALAIRQHSLPLNHPDLAASYNNIGNVYFNTGEDLKALSYHEKALAIQQQSLPPNHPSLGDSYNSIGNGCSRMGEYSKALSYYEKVLAIREQSLLPNHPGLGESCNSIGNACFRVGEYSKALSSFEKALAIRQQSLPPNHSDFGDSYNNIGNVYSHMDEYSKALSYYEKSVAIRQESLPPNHSDLGNSYNNIGVVYIKKGDYSKALSYYEKALAIQQQSLPSNDPDLGDSYNNIGLIYNNMGDHSKARWYHEKALAIRQQSLSPNHPDIGGSYNNIGLVYGKMGDYSKALSFLERAVDNGQRSLPSNHPHLKLYRKHLERIRKKL